VQINQIEVYIVLIHNKIRGPSFYVKSQV
jgi:hypothetical protein